MQWPNLSSDKLLIYPFMGSGQIVVLKEKTKKNKDNIEILKNATFLIGSWGEPFTMSRFKVRLKIVCKNAPVCELGNNRLDFVRVDLEIWHVISWIGDRLSTQTFYSLIKQILSEIIILARQLPQKIKQRKQT